MLLTIKSVQLLLLFVIINVNYYINCLTSYDTIISSQCKAKCLSLYPWRSAPSTPTQQFVLSKRHLLTQAIKPNQQQNGGESTIKWHKVMELCAKNPTCLQCSLPCDIPKYLLKNCKYLCKNRHSSCIDSCNLLLRLNEDKTGTCDSNNTTTTTTTTLATNNDFYSYDSQEQEQQQQERVDQTCENDFDCDDLYKCCQTKCVMPKLSRNASLTNLASIPTNLTIIERKKGKTVILKWNCAYNKQTPTIFVIEGKWSLNNDDDDEQASDENMTKWGYLAQTVNHNSVILRNIHRGRWYKFRMTAITKHGTLGYSRSTDLFMLSSPPKPPSTPENLTISNPSSDITVNSNQTINVRVTWLPPKRSDLPIMNYKIVWQEINDDNMSSVMHITNNSNDDDGYSEDDDNEGEEQLMQISDNERKVNTKRKKNVDSISENEDIRVNKHVDLIDSTKNSYIINGLYRNKIYLVELFAISKYKKDYLISNQAKFVINVNKLLNLDDYDRDSSDYESNSDELLQIITQQTPTTKRDTTITNYQIRNLTIDTAYFQNGLVKARLNWILINKYTSELISFNEYLSNLYQFRLTWFPIKCLFKQQLPAPITSTTSNYFIEIYDLIYNCDYVVNVRLTSKEPQQTSPQQQQVIASTQFKVPNCDLIRIVGRIKPICETNVNKTDSNSEPVTSTSSTSSSNRRELPIIEDITYLNEPIDSQTYQTEFRWSLPSDIDDSQIHGYQISIVPRTSNYQQPSSAISLAAILDKNEKTFLARNLKYSIDYIFQIQLIERNTLLLGPSNSIEFSIKPQFQLTSSTHKYELLINNQINQDENDVLKNVLSSSIRNTKYNNNNNNRKQDHKQQQLLNNSQNNTQSSSLLNYFYYKTNSQTNQLTSNTSILTHNNRIIFTILVLFAVGFIF